MGVEGAADVREGVMRVPFIDLEVAIKQSWPRQWASLQGAFMLACGWIRSFSF